MAEIAFWLSAFLIGLGSAVYVVGAVGLVRMPNFYTRLHAVSVSDTLGAFLILAGLMIAGGLTLVTAKLAIVLFLLFLTAPFATHALAQTALHEGVEPLPPDDARRPPSPSS